VLETTARLAVAIGALEAAALERTTVLRCAVAKCGTCMGIATGRTAIVVAVVVCTTMALTAARQIARIALLFTRSTVTGTPTTVLKARFGALLETVVATAIALATKTRCTKVVATALAPTAATVIATAIVATACVAVATTPAGRRSLRNSYTGFFGSRPAMVWVLMGCWL